MPQRDLDINTPKTISASTGVGISQDLSARRAVRRDCEQAVSHPPPPTLLTLS